ncbi:hypothetical protein Q7P37_000990 [Cladosporium fusiforme]
MSALLEDPVHFDRYFGPSSSGTSKEAIQLRIFEWSSGQFGARTDTAVFSAAELFARDSEVECQLRIVLAPSQSSFGTAEHNAFRAIFQYYDVPSTFVSEYFTSPAYSLGHSKDSLDLDVEVAWTRFLCKDVLSDSHTGADDKKVFFDNFLWIKCVAFLHVRNKKDGSRCVTMLCFGARPPIERRFVRLLESDAWMDAVQEPYILFAIIYEQCFLMLDEAAWTLARWFRPLERSTLNRARDEFSGSEQLWSTDFAKLHDIAKHGIYLSEAATAAGLEMASLISHLQAASRPSDTKRLSQATISKFQYQMVAFQSTKLRLSSLEKRIANVISLSFNLVTQRDSRLLKHDSNAMKAIALLTLIFLPMTGIASLFDTPFFEVSGGVINVALSFWVFWLITICLTVAMIVFWLWWYRTVKRRAMLSPPDRVLR